MKMKVKVDYSGCMKSLNEITMTETVLRSIEYAGSRPLVNIQRQLVPADTAATKASINSHVVESSATRVVDEVGPETEYAPYLEYGTGVYAESGKGRKGGWFYKDSKGWHFTMGMRPRPFVRPSVNEGSDQVFSAITQAFKLWLESQWKT